MVAPVGAVIRDDRHECLGALVGRMFAVFENTFHILDEDRVRRIHIMVHPKVARSGIGNVDGLDAGNDQRLVADEPGARLTPYQSGGPQRPIASRRVQREIALDRIDQVNESARFNIGCRVDYLAGMIYNWGYVGTVERALGIALTDRCQYIRVIVSELQRLASHLLWFGAFLMDLGNFTPFLYCFQDREEILDMFEMCDGSRLTYNYFRFGGQERDLSPEMLDRAKQFIPMLRSHLKDYEKLVAHNIIFKKRTEGVGVITRDQALAYGVTGASLRATGIPYDVRKVEPYGIYDQFQWDVPTAKAGDAFARFEVRVEEMHQSLRILEQALARIPEGPYNNPAAPKRFKPDAGEYYFCVESPRGQMGIYLISDGTENPYRIKMRTPCYSNLQVMKEVARNHFLADVVCILGSLDIVVPDVDR